MFKNRGKQFDPFALDAFLEVVKKIPAQRGIIPNNADYLIIGKERKVWLPENRQKVKKSLSNDASALCYEKDRSNYSGKFVQGFVHNANGPLQNLTMLTEMLISGLELQDQYIQEHSGENEKWSELLGKQRKTTDPDARTNIQSGCRLARIHAAL